MEARSTELQLVEVDLISSFRKNAKTACFAIAISRLRYTIESSVDGIVFVSKARIIFVCYLCPKFRTVTDLQTAKV